MTGPTATARRRMRLGPLGVPVDPMTLDEAAGVVVEAAAARTALPVHLVNAYTVVCAHERPDVAAALAEGPLNLTDGMPLVWLARRLGADPAVTRVYGPDLFCAVVDAGRAAGLRHYLYGGDEETVAALASALRTRFPGAVVCGSEAPPFRPLTETETASAQDRVRRSGADIVWVGLGTPKQDLVTAAWAPELGVPVVAVGAAFDFLAGRKRQAPRLLQRAGLEWLFRLVTEPRRLAGRYLKGNVTYLRLVRRRAELDTTPGEDVR